MLSFQRINLRKYINFTLVIMKWILDFKKTFKFQEINEKKNPSLSIKKIMIMRISIKINNFFVNVVLICILDVSN